MTQHVDHKPTKSRGRTGVLIGLLLFFMVTGVAFFFYGLTRQFEAEKNFIAAKEQERAALSRIRQLEDQLEDCRTNGGTTSPPTGQP